MAYKVGSVFEATNSFAVFGIKPTRADKRKKDIARFEPLLENVTKVLPQGDIVHVHEHRTLANQFDQVVFQSSRLTFRVPRR